MRYKDFEHIISEERMTRYVQACGGNTRKAMTLYRYNIELSQVMFAIICHFEVALRNAIDSILSARLGNEWLKNAAQPGGLFDTPATRIDFTNIKKSYDKLTISGLYTHSKLLTSLEFGFWKYQFAPTRFRLTGQRLMRVFPNKARSSASIQYNHSYIFNELDKINTLRNRIAHHEPICFPNQGAVIYTEYILNEYHKIITLFQWMGIDSSDLLYGLDHVQLVCKKMEKLRET